ncbi:unnamed protein product [Rotaria socialis]|uniref:Uncharacterized protein n=1 Tax=Rotaria socialis TaxID=392032 RepID=A0A820YVF9_9BILA|nr:unnamed protein product [Rotaria socialis]CAF3493184.1 unnamed protein product [Rotaria socialis]CAF3702125.1 unnamed protein product [Rotaria socialis]CAF4178632.1 unnamed protein product [Rotaria socialis]CAF4346842.1 unnamed protein product [Rotaria socialis]
MFGAINSETPPYDVIAKKDGYEIRRYSKQLMAQKTKISTAAPVIMQETESDSFVKRTMSFTMAPSKFKSLDQPPTPNDKTIETV